MQAALVFVYEHLQHIRNLHEFRFLPVTTENKRKTIRIGTWAAMLKQTDKQTASYALTEGDYIITQQLLAYEPLRQANDDDIIDCCAMGPQMVNKYMAEILQTLPNRVQGGVVPSVRISKV